MFASKEGHAAVALREFIKDLWRKNFNIREYFTIFADKNNKLPKWK